MLGVIIPSPMTIEVPIIEMNKSKCFANWLFSNADFTFEALRNRPFGNSTS